MPRGPKPRPIMQQSVVLKVRLPHQLAYRLEQATTKLRRRGEYTRSDVARAAIERTLALAELAERDWLKKQVDKVKGGGPANGNGLSCFDLIGETLLIGKGGKKDAHGNGNGAGCETEMAGERSGAGE